MLHTLWTIALLLVATMCAAKAWLHLSTTDDSSAERALFWQFSILLPLALIVDIQRGTLAFGTMVAGWSKVLPEPHTKLNEMTSILLTLAVWLLVFVAINGLGALVVEGWALRCKRNRARALTATILRRTGRIPTGE
ncbi:MULTISPECIES: hypothetical protein [Cupriavidus]